MNMNDLLRDFPTCPYCSGAAHPIASCPEVSAIEYFRDGTIKRVEKRDKTLPTTFHYNVSTSGVSENWTQTDTK
jgi:hypothetical protein